MSIAFTKVKLEYGWLGNMAPFPIVYNDKEWRTTEALFQALRFEDDTIREEIRAQRSPMAAKMVAKKYPDKISVIPISEKDIENMELVCKLKLEQHPELKEKLKETGEQLIVEDVTKRPNGRNIVWGAALKDGVWEGQNILGKIWMKLRKELVND